MTTKASACLLISGASYPNFSSWYKLPGGTTCQILKNVRGATTSPEMVASEFMVTIPAMGEAKYGTQSKIMSDKAGFLLWRMSVFRCHLVEFFHET